MTSYEKLFSLRSVYIIVFSTLIAWSIFSYLTMKEVINSKKNYANMINITGKQRMFLIRTELLVKDNIRTKQNSIGELKKIYNAMKNDYKYIIENLTSKRLEKIYFEKPNNLDTKINKYFNLIDAYIEKKPEWKLEHLETLSKELLPSLDYVVTSFENESDSKIMQLEKRELLILIGVLSTLLLEAIFIVIPSLKYIERKTLDEKRQRVKLKNKIDENKEELKYAEIVFDNTHDGIIITDKNMKILNVNKAFEKTTGYNLSEVYGESPRTLQSGMYDREFYKKMWDEINSKGFWEGELVSKTKSGDLYIEWLTISSVFDKNKKVKNYIGVFSDMTNLKKQEENLRKQEKMLYEQSKMAAMGEMIENIAHQWRQPLSIISTIATGIKIQKENNVMSVEDELKQLDSLNETAQYLSKTIDDFRNFLKSDKTIGKFEVSDLLEKSINIISSKLTNSNVVIELNKQELYISGLRNELQQVFINILNNAKDALGEKEEDEKIIVIDMYEKDKKAIVLIKDNAGGIREEIIDRIFEPYFTTKHKSQGTGIGLYMSSKMINGHMEGSLSVENQTFEYKSKIYKGACFKIEIPISSDLENS